MAILPSYDDFTALYKVGKPQVVHTTLVADLETPVSAFLKLTGGRPNCCLFESVEGGATIGRYSFITMKPDVLWRCRDGKAEINHRARFDATAFEKEDLPPLESLRKLVEENAIELPEELPPMAANIIGYMGYDMVREMESLPDLNARALDVPDSLFMRPTIIAVFDRVEDTVTVFTPVWPEKGRDPRQDYNRACERLADVVADFDRALPVIREADEFDLELPPISSNMSPQDYLTMVAKAKEYILAGDIFQVVLSQRFSLPFELPPFALYRALRRLNPSPFLFFLNFGDFAVVGSSPEILVRLRDGTVTIRPIAGTRRRGENAAEDQALAEDLLSDPKELAEHLMLLDLGRNDVGRVSEIGTVKVTARETVEFYSHVMHIVSNVEGTLKSDGDAVSALVAGFPAGTVSGAPKVRAMEIIEELEPDRRGIYAGAVGYFGANGAMDTCIALRTAVVKDGVMTVQAGAGIVADSVPQSEHEECQNKSKALVHAAEEAVRFAAERRGNL